MNKEIAKPCQSSAAKLSPTGLTTCLVKYTEMMEINRVLHGEPRESWHGLGLDSNARNLVDLSLRYFRRRRPRNAVQLLCCSVCSAALPSMGRAMLAQRPHFKYL